MKIYYKIIKQEEIKALSNLIITPIFKFHFCALYSIFYYQLILPMSFSKINIIIILIFHQIHYAFSFNFAGLTVSSDSTTINVTTNYQFYFDRSVDNNGNPTAYNTNFVPAGSNVVIVFPSIYVLSSSYTCSPGSSGTTNGCTINGQNVTISGLFNTATNVTILEIDISNVLNPSPAVTTGYFYGYIGSDAAIPINSQSYVQLDNALFSSCSITFNPSYMNKSQSMIFTIQPKNLIWSGGYIIIKFPIYGAWNEDIAQQPFNISSSMTCSNITSNVSPSLICSGNSSTKIVNITGLFSSNNINIFSLALANMTSPPNSNVVSQDQFTITSYYQGNSIDQCTPYVTGLTPNILPSFIITTTPQTLTVNTANVSIKMNITFADTFRTGLNSIQIVFPSSYNLSMSGTPSSTISGAFASYSFTSTNNTLTMSTTSGKTYIPNTSIYVNFNYWTVPPSIATLSAITFNVQRNGLTTQTASSSILQPTVSSNITIAINPVITTVSTNTSYVISLTLGDPISTSGLISITFPSTIALIFTSSNCASVTGTLTNNAPTCTMNSSNTLLLTNLNSSNSVIPAQTLTITINGVQNPSTTQPSSTFNITTYYTSSYDMVATVVTGSVTATPGILNSSFISLTASNYVVQNTNTTYTFGFNNLNALSTGSIIQIGIPASCLVSGTLNCTGILGVGTLTTQSCITSTLGQYTYINITSLLASTSASANSTFKIALNGMVTNPPSTAPVTGFSIVLFAPSGYIINHYISGLSLTMVTPANFNSISVNHSSNVNYASNSITVTLSQPSPFLTGSLMTVYFPSTIIPQPTVTCTDLTSASVPCTLSSNTVTANLLSNVSNTSFGLIISNVFNAPSLKPSSTFGFATLTSTGYYYSQNLASGTLTNTQTSNFLTLTGTFSNLLLGTSQILTITFKPTNAITGWVVIKLASSFTLNSLGCLGWTGSCGISSNFLNISGVFNLSTNIININGFTSPNSLPSDYTTITTYDSSGYPIDSSAGTIIFALNCTLPCATCAPAVTNCITCYTSTSITTYNYYYSATLSCFSSCPAGTYTDSVNYMCINCSNICLTCNSSTYCLSCLKTSSYPYLNTNASTSTSTCLASCPVGSYANTSQSNYFCSLCVSPCSQCLSATYCTACVSGYYFNSSGSNCLVSCTPNFTITNSTNMSCDACASVCYSCSTTTINCDECSSTAALYLGTCVANCPSHLVVNAGSCTPCTNPCLTCVTTATNCTSCNSSTTTPFLLNNSCVASCPIYYYNISVSGSCYNCSLLGINCAICINSTTCSTNCDTGFVYLNGNCLAIVPAGYVNISGMALPCTNGCATCTILQANCITCNTSLYFYLNTCISNCPTGYAAINLNCTACLSPCLTCVITTSNCLSCNPAVNPSVYLFGTSCLTICPSGTYSNLLNNTCIICVSPCQTCTNVVTCQTCVSTYSLYSSSCLLNCPSGYTSINSVCLSCTSPCATCSGSQILCTSCLTNLIPTLYLVVNQCVVESSCPAGTYANTATYQCSSCVSPCATCTSSSICLTCILNYYYFSSTCITSCLSGYVGINYICYACTSPCYTCSITQINCTSCLTNLVPNVFLTGNICVTSSNCPSTTYGNTTNNICSNCVSPCLICTSFSACTSCIQTYSLFLTQCLSSCPTGYISINSICVQCTSPCYTCDTTKTNCTSCLTNLNPSVYLSINSCIIASLCPSSTYANSTTNSCSNCPSNCATCTSLILCNNCANNYYLQGSSCLTSCNSGYQQINGICTQCTSPCATCSVTITNCTSCLSTVNPTVYLTGNNCVNVSSCPYGTYGNNSNNQCTNCTSPCLTCSSASICLSCVSTYSLYNSNCISNCPSGYYSNTTNCLVCTSPCATCNSSSTNCTSCITNLNPTVYFTSLFTCVQASSCPTQTYANGSNYQCTACVNPCLTCTTATACLTCVSNYNYLASNNSCLSSCPSGTVNVSSICTTCTSPCATCSGSVTSCLSCLASVTPTVYFYGTSCTTICNSGYYGDNATRTCLPCVSPCATCINQSACLSCSIRNLYNSGCVTPCPSGYYSSNSQCLACSSPCLTCDSTANNCTSCITSLNPTVYLTTYYTCVTAANCPLTTYANGANYQCVTCVTPCSNCISATLCTACQNGYSYLSANNSCLSLCPSGQVSINAVCLNCISPCLTCSGTVNSCLSCNTTIIPNVFLSGTLCVASCPTNYYGDINSYTCLSCTSPCLTCSSASICLSCVSTYSLYNSNCISNCPSGYYSNTTNCLVCTSPCATCSSSSTNCTSCFTNLNPTVYFTSLFTCVQASSCPTQTYANGSNYQCTACVNPCLTCTTATACLTCMSNYNYLASNNSCLSSCPPGLTAVSAICTTCTSPCATCSGSVDSCLSCLASVTPTVYLSGTSCTTTCPTYFYADITTRSCLACVTPCSTCTNQIVCLSCLSGNSLYNGGCYNSCPAGYYTNTTNCLLCTSPCLTCSLAATNCTSCVTTLIPSVYLANNNCVQASNCPDQTYANGSLYQCMSCISPCKTCTTLSSCLTCANTFNYLASNNSCLSSCPPGLTAVSAICTTCTSPCATCSGSVDSCLSCLASVTPTVYLSGTSCTTTCPTYFYADITTRSCLACVTPCSTCTNQIVCLSCLSGNSLYNGGCYNSCPAGYYTNTTNCLLCTSPCLTCSLAATNCTSCVTTLIPSVYLANNNCVQASNCPTQTYANVSNYQCTACVNQCLTCTTATACLTCVINYNYLASNNSCLSSCPSGTVNVSSICTICTSPCATCSGSVTSCLSCLASVTPTVYLSGTSCTTTCPTYFYADITTRSCLACVTPCSTCTNQIVCLSCTTGYLYNFACYPTCPNGYYQSSSMQCLSCKSPCLTCINAQTNCTSCITTLTPSVYLTSFHTCVPASNCPSQTYANNSNYQCTICVTPCSTCTTISICSSCVTGYYLSGSLCVTSCPIGQLAVNLICTPCTSPCLTCANQLTSCLSCDPSLDPSVYLRGNSCLQTCPSTTYPNTNNLTCTSCVSPCATCSSLSVCISCSSGYTFYSSYCYSACPSGLVSVNQICVGCTSPCLTCINSSTICLSCVIGYYYVTTSTSCVTTCPSNLFINSTSQTCVGCVSPCSTCTTYPNNCSSCISNYYLLSGNSSNTTANSTCISSCPSSYYILGSICQRCPTLCQTCTSFTICTTCLSNYFLYSSNCVTGCPPTISIIINYTCISCSDSNCQNCSTVDNCTICISPYLLLNGSCYQTCPSPYVANVTYCYNPAEISLNSSLSSTNLLPMPFTIATGCIIIVCFILKFKYQYFFVSGGIFSLTSIPQVLVNIYFAYLYYQWIHLNLSNTIFILILAALGFLYLLNIICFLIVNCVYLKDQEFQIWIQSVSSKITYVFVTVLAVFLNHKIINVLFCKIFHFSVFKAKLVHVSKLFCLHFLWFISLIYTVSGITLASYHLYNNGSIKDQLYIQSFDLIIVFLLNAIFGFLNTHKDQNFFEQEDGNVIFSKKNQSQIDEFNGSIASSANIMIQKQKGKGTNYKHAEIDSDLHQNLTIVEQIQQLSSFTNNNESKLREQLKNKLDKIKKNDNTRIEEDNISSKQRKKRKDKGNIQYIEKDIQQSIDQQSVIFDKNDEYTKRNTFKNNKITKLRPDPTSQSEDQNFLRMSSNRKSSQNNNRKKQIRKNIDQDKPRNQIRDKTSILNQQNKEDLPNISFREDIFDSETKQDKTLRQDSPQTQIRDNKSVHLNKQTKQDFNNISFKQDRPFSKQINLYDKSLRQDIPKSEIKDKSVQFNKSTKEDKLNHSFNQDAPTKYQKSSMLNKSIKEDQQKSQIKENKSAIINKSTKQDLQKILFKQDIPKDDNNSIMNKSNKSVKQDVPRNELDEKSTIINKSGKQEKKLNENRQKSSLNKSLNKSKEDFLNKVLKEDLNSKIIQESQLKSFKDDSFSLDPEPTRLRNPEFQKKLKQKQSQLALIRKKLQQKQTPKTDFDFNKRLKQKDEGDQLQDSELLSQLKYSQQDIDQNRRKIQQLSMSIVQKKEEDEEQSMMEEIQKSLQRYNIFDPIKKRENLLKNDQKLPFNFQKDDFSKISQEDSINNLKIKSSIKEKKIIEQEDQSEGPHMFKQNSKYTEEEDARAHKIMQSSEDQQEMVFNNKDPYNQNSKKSNITVPQKKLRFEHEIESSIRESEQQIIRAPTYVKIYGSPSANMQDNLLANSKNVNSDELYYQSAKSKDSAQTVYRVKPVKPIKLEKQTDMSFGRKEPKKQQNQRKKTLKAEIEYLSESEPETQKEHYLNHKIEKDIPINKLNHNPQQIENGAIMQFKVLGPHVSKSPVLNSPLTFKKKSTSQQEFPSIDKKSSSINRQKTQNQMPGNLEAKKGTYLDLSSEDKKSKSKSKDRSIQKNVHMPRILSNSRQTGVLPGGQSKISKSIENLMNPDMNILPRPKYDEELKDFYKTGLSRSRSKGKKQGYNPNEKDREVEKIYIGRKRSRDKL